MTEVATFDFVVIGAGIAGASVAAHLAADARVAVLEQESQPGFHATGRSAAVYAPSYGPPVIRALTRASGPFFHDPESPHIPHPLLTPRDTLFTARADQAQTLAAFQNEIGEGLSLLTGAEAQTRMPLLRAGYAQAAALDRSAADIDVDALHQHYLKTLRAAQGTLITRARVRGLRRDSGQWLTETNQGLFAAPVVINAAGAWADEIAGIAGIAPLGLTPKRRTALIVATPGDALPDDCPMVVDVEEQFYLKPEAGKLLISPADETPSAPCDAQPDEMDIAICADRIMTAFDVDIRRIEQKWAGLRSFLPDGCPAAGFDPQAPGFFWLAGQGGYGIQTAPALSRAAAALARGDALPDDIVTQGVTPQALSPARAGLRG